MEIKVGGVYKARNGDRVEIVGDNGHITYPFKGDNNRSYTPYGIFWQSVTEHPYNLIAEWQDEPDQHPTIWLDMTDAEKGELLLADHERKVIEYWRKDKWINSNGVALFLNNCAYRIKPTPKVETVTMYASDKMKGFGLAYGPRTKYRITFTTIDGKPDPSSIKMEELV